MFKKRELKPVNYAWLIGFLSFLFEAVPRAPPLQLARELSNYWNYIRSVLPRSITPMLHSCGRSLLVASPLSNSWLMDWSNVRPIACLLSLNYFQSPRKNRRFKIFLLSNAGRGGERALRCNGSRSVFGPFPFRFRTAVESRSFGIEPVSRSMQTFQTSKLSAYFDAKYRWRNLTRLRNFTLFAKLQASSNEPISPIRSIPILFSFFFFLCMMESFARSVQCNRVNARE